MGSSKVYATLAGFLAVAASTMTARAADLLPPPPMPEPFEVASVGGGWYLRGDVGVSHYDGDKFRNAQVPTAVFSGENFGSGGFAGAGVGYQFNNWFRADVTGEYRFSTGISVRDRDSFFDAAGNGITSYERLKGDYSSTLVMLNGYVDLGTWYGVTPFIGAGVGWGHHWLSGFDTSTVNVYANPAIGSGVSGGTVRDAQKDNFAWALHAGIGYDVTQNVKLEVAYRYLNFGDVRTGQIDCFCGAVFQGQRVRDLQAHDIKIGMRWMFGDSTPVDHPPLMRKY